MAASLPPRQSLIPQDMPSSEPQATPPEDRVLRRAMDTATIRLLDGAAAAQGEIGALRGDVGRLTASVDELRASSGRMEQGMAQLVALQAEANRLRAAELDEARAARQQREAAAEHTREVEAAEKLERSRWWRSIAEPRTVSLIAIAVVLWLLGQGALIPAILNPAKGAP